MSCDGSEVRLYYREGCQLCEELAAFLFRYWPDVAVAVHWVDVDRDPVVAARYGLELPVLECAGAVVCRTRADADALTDCFGPPRIPV
jgi:hypothetical protein